MTRNRFLTLAACVSLVVPVLAVGAQNPGPARVPEKPKNLKVFPKDIPVRALLDTMGTFTRALGVNCSFCHMVGDDGPHDFSSDQKPNKEKARTMLRMVEAINGEYLPKLPSRLQPPVVVTCATCHRGVAEPRQLQQVLLTRYNSAGTDSAIALYRELRQRYYGRASYDFGEAPLEEVGGALRQQNHIADALKFYQLNLEYAPTSASAWASLAGGQLASGDTATAIQSYQKALSLDPKDRQATRALQMLKPKQ